MYACMCLCVCVSVCLAGLNQLEGLAGLPDLAWEDSLNMCALDPFPCETCGIMVRKGPFMKFVRLDLTAASLRAQFRLALRGWGSRISVSWLTVHAYSASTQADDRCKIIKTHTHTHTRARARARMFTHISVTTLDASFLLI